MKPIKYNLIPDDDIEMVADSFRLIFGQDVEAVLTKNVKPGGTSAYVYVPNEFIGKRVTMIVWNDKNKYYHDGLVLTEKQAQKIEEKIAEQNENPV